MGNNQASPKNQIFRGPSIFLIILWVVIATFRVITDNIGGADSLGYIEWFEQSLNPNYSFIAHENSIDFSYTALMKIIRSVTSDYHVFFSVTYAIIVIGFILCVGRFTKKEYSAVPFFMVFYLFLRSFNTLRSVLAISVILIGLYYLAKQQYLKTYLFFFLSLFTHTASVLFALVIPVSHLLSLKSINRKVIILAFVGMLTFANFLRIWFLDFFDGIDLGGAYQSYAREERTIWASSTEFFGQYLLGTVILVYYNRIINYIKSVQDLTEQRSLKIMLFVCIYDFILTPFNTFLGIWRGYEFFYIVRLCMWSLLIFLFTKNESKDLQILVRFIFLACFAGWFVFRLSRTYESSLLMPYMFAF